MNIAVIYWIDACHSDKLEHIDEAIKTLPLKIVDVGILLKQDKDNIIIASSYDEEDRVKYINLIPKKYIKKMRIIKIKDITK